jgi:outer membrane lipoprotein-sorting protein
MKKIILSLFVLSAFIFFLDAQTPDEVIGKYHRSIGGIDKLKSHTSTKAMGKAPTSQGEFPFELYQEKPNKIKVVIDIMGKKMVAQAYDGQTAWMLNPFMGETAQRLPPDQAKSIVEEAEFEDPFLDYNAKGYEVTLEGSEDIQNVPCFKVKLLKYKGNPDKESTQYYYFNKETFLPFMVQTLVPSGPQAGQMVETYLSDYRDAGNGMIMPYSFEVKVGNQVVQSMIFETITLNEDIPDDAFKFPGDTQ